MLASLLVLGCGCAVDQAKDVSQYRRMVDLPPATRPAGQPLSLREALRLTNERSERLSIEGENYLQAMLDRKRSLAAFLPVFSISGSYLVADTSSQTSINNAADAWLSGNINLFNGFRDVQRLKAADLTIDQRRLLLLDFQESLLADTLRAYFNVLRNERLVAVLEHTSSLQDSRVRDITIRQEAGTARPLDVAQSQSQASRTRVELLNARRDSANARAALSFLTHTQLHDLALVENDSLAAPAEGLPEVQLRAAMTRQDLLASVAAQAAARRRVEVAVGQYYPSLSLDMRTFLTRDTNPTDRDWDSVLEANLPIFSAGRIEADVRQAWSEYRQAALFASLLSRQVQQDVEVAWRNLQASRQRLAELAVQLSAARQALAQAEGSYNVGLATNLERLTAQDELLSAELQQASERYNYWIYSGDLLRAVGGLRAAIEEPATRPASLPTTATTQP